MRIVARTMPALRALLLLAALARPAAAVEIVVFGDSWGVRSGPALQTVLAEHGHSEWVDFSATDGETAWNLASPSGLQYITDRLFYSPDVRIVHLSIGGNDFRDWWQPGMSPESEAVLFQSITDDVELIVDHILAEAPGVRILWSSYDYPRPGAIPGATPAEVNAAADSFQAHAQALATSKGASLTALDFDGLMQVSYGFDGVQYTSYDPPYVIPPGDPSLPDPTLPSPMAAYADYIHLTSEGYLVLAEEQYVQFYGPVLHSGVTRGGWGGGRWGAMIWGRDTFAVSLLSPEGLVALAGLLLFAAGAVLARRHRAVEP